MSDQRDAKYIVEIYEPGNAHDVSTTFKSDAPFQAIAAGDLINLTVSGNQFVEVTKVEHILWEAGDVVKHKLCVFTKAVPDTPESRGTKRY